VTYKTAWYLCHRIRAAMAAVDHGPLKGIVEVDETYVGGKPRPGVDPIFRRDGKRYTGRGTRKTPVLAMVERGGKVKLGTLKRIAAPELLPKIWDSVQRDDTTIFTDSLGAYEGVGRKVKGGHRRVNHSAGEWVTGKVHTNTVEGVFSLLKRSIIGSYHKVSKKHLPSYLEEVEFKYNNRENPYIFRETIKALVLSEPIPYSALIDKAS